MRHGYYHGFSTVESNLIRIRFDFADSNIEHIRLDFMIDSNIRESGLDSQDGKRAPKLQNRLLVMCQASKARKRTIASRPVKAQATRGLALGRKVTYSGGQSTNPSGTGRLSRLPRLGIRTRTSTLSNVQLCYRGSCTTSSSTGHASYKVSKD